MISVQQELLKMLEKLCRKRWLSAMAFTEITVLASNWPSAPIYHLQTRSLRLHGRMIKATTHSSVSSAYSSSKETCFSTFIQIFFLSLLSTVCFSALGSNKNGNHNTISQKSLHCINNDVTVAIINIVHTLWSAVHLQQNVITLVAIFRCSVWKNVL